MPKLTKEELQSLIDAVKHYQQHHLSITRYRYQEYSNILNVLINEITN